MEQKRAICLRHLIGINTLAVDAQDISTQWSMKIELQRIEHLKLHAKNLITVVGPLRHVDEVVQLRWIYLLILGSHQHGADAE